VQVVGGVRADSFVLDGEIVAVDAGGRPSFQALHHVSLDGVSIVYYAFDLLHLNGRDLTRLPLDERRAALRTVIAGSGVFLSDPLPGTPAQIATAVRRLGLEGVVAKRRRSAYATGRRSDAWVKVRFARRQELVVGGFKPLRDTFDSLVVGYYDGTKLMSAGKVRSGFTPHARHELWAQLASLQTSRCPFANLPSVSSAHWGRGLQRKWRCCAGSSPYRRGSVVHRVDRDGSLRHAAFVARRDDKAARDVVRAMSSG
jgi:bifunctional non-homologous end joining protein LigD